MKYFFSGWYIYKKISRVGTKTNNWHSENKNRKNVYARKFTKLRYELRSLNECYTSILLVYLEFAAVRVFKS